MYRVLLSLGSHSVLKLCRSKQGELRDRKPTDLPAETKH